MPESYFTSLEKKEKAAKLLDLELPSYRQAYSDRTAWVMSVLSELVYIKFNPLFGAVNSADGNAGDQQEYIKTYFVDRIARMIDADRAQLLTQLIEQVAYDHEGNSQLLGAQLAEFDFKTIATFDRGGTQAILVENGSYMVLVFRGTETDSLADIKADAKASIRKCETRGMIHSGFYDAYNEIRNELETQLLSEQCVDKPLYITGHSLGGALATVATKLIHHKGGLAACYTYGSPRVGNDEWINNIKTPIHRLVNAADCVTMLPPGDTTVSLLALIIKCLPSIGQKTALYLQEKFGGYMHAGNMRYLTNCKPGDFDDVKVLYTVSFWFRIKALFYKSLPFTKLLADHSISIYSTKLMIIAFKRNKKKMDAVGGGSTNNMTNNTASVKPATKKTAAKPKPAAKAASKKTTPTKAASPKAPKGTPIKKPVAKTTPKSVTKKPDV
ncbi:lipase family protein [Glaciecola petra]|uniref:Lipase family protein n=1 Tax=Glaciecola petra TaxID=3075602 RepID=A0ABU2ZQW4_9ALTE|nr:lipase family protein [Aestuariibacter sp. P117]MDT0594656.1 lipase family protein [Aestuariibacter sp. P117]